MNAAFFAKSFCFCRSGSLQPACPTPPFQTEVFRQPTQQIALDLIEPEAPTLENFVAGDNAELVAALKACRAGLGPQFIYIWGPPGSGRTHLLRSLTPFQRWRVPEFDESVCLYTVDNVEQLNEEDLEKLFHLMNAVRSHPSARLVTAGAHPVRELAVREDIRTRLSWGLAYRIDYLPDVLAEGEFVRLAQARGLRISPEFSRWVSEHGPRDMRGLREFLDKIDRRCMQTKKKVSFALLNECLQSFNAERRRYPALTKC